ncbi:MAG: response regulator [Phycisphaerales bacterium]|nr:MAG: response regulator [Phycisphaerales bacterium]
MTDRSHKIMLVEPDAEVLEILVASLSRRFDAHITCVADVTSCLDIEIFDPHDLVIAELELEDSGGLELSERLMALSNRPVILLANQATCDDVTKAMRLGVSDLFRKPFRVEQLLDATDRALREHDLYRRRAAKYRRMRELVRRIISERRDLNRRIELICRDLVGAQRRLVHRVLALEEKKPHQVS